MKKVHESLIDLRYSIEQSLVNSKDASVKVVSSIFNGLKAINTKKILLPQFSSGCFAKKNDVLKLH